MVKKISTMAIEYRHITLCVILLITAFFCFEIKNVVIKTDLTDLYPQNHQFIKIHNKYTGQLGSPFKVFMMLKVKEGNIYNKETLEKVIRITDGLDAIPGVNHNHVYSIASRKIKKMRITKESIIMENLMGEIPASMDEFIEIVRSTPSVYGIWVSRNEKSVFFSASFIEQLMDHAIIHECVQKLIEKESDANHSIYAAGEPILMGWVTNNLQQMYMIFGCTFLAFVCLLWLYFRNLLGVLTQLPPMILGAIWFLGFSGFLGYNVDPLVLVVPVLIVARSLSHSVQFTQRYFETYHSQKEKDVKKACIETLEHILPPGMLGIVTDALGILLIAVAPIPMMQKLAYLCGFWAFSNIFSCMIFTPVFISYSASWWRPKNIDKIVDMDKGLTQRILGVIAKLGYGKAGITTFIITIVLAAFTGWFASKVEIGDIYPGSSILWEDSDYNVAIDQMNKNFPGTEELYVLFEGDSAKAVEEPKFLSILNSFQAHMEEGPLVGRTLSITDKLETLYRAIYYGYPKWEMLPQDRKQSGELFNTLNNQSAPGDYDLFFSQDESVANVTIWYKDHMHETLVSAIERVREFMDGKKDLLDRVNCNMQLASGNIGLLAAINETVQDSQFLNFFLVMGVVFLLCSLTYRSVVAAIILMIPLNITNIITLTIMYFLKIGLNINTLPVVSVGVGVGIDYGIYLLSRICEEYQSLGGEYSSDFTTMPIKTTGKAIFFTGTTMIAGVIFWYFLSSTKFQAEMGLLLALIMFINIIGALVLIPTLVNIFRPKFLGRVKFTHSSNILSQNECY